MKKYPAAIVAIVIVAVVGAVAYYATRPSVPTPTVGIQVVTAEELIYRGYPSATYEVDYVMYNVYEPLVRYDPTQDKYIPLLATSWELSEDSLVWTFNLRRGVKFHTGNEFKADAVKYSIEKYIEEGWGAYYLWDSVEEIKVIDDYTVQFVLSYPVPLPDIASAGWSTFIVDPVVSEEKTLDWFREGGETGTGPYMIESYNPELNQVVLTKFDDYWGGWEGKFFDNVIIKAVPDTSTARLMLEAGEADYVTWFPPETIEALKENPDIRMVEATSFKNMNLMLNTQKPPLNNKLVRQALSYATPYEEIIDVAMGGYGRQSWGPVPHRLFGHSEELFQYTHDLTKAKELLTEAGYPEGGFSLSYTVTYGIEEERRVGEVLKAELAKLGIDLDIQVMPWESKWEITKAPDPMDRQDICPYIWWPDYNDPYSFLFNLFHSEEDILWNSSYYSNPTVDELMEEAHGLTGVDTERAAELYFQAQQIIVDDAPAVFAFDYNIPYATRASLKGFVDNPLYPYIVFWYDTYRE